jgi:branched-chain amino acid transport system permease protein
MADIVRLLAGGAGNAAIYALLALSLVLVHRGSGVLNFGVGHLAIFCGIFFANLGAGQGGWGALVITLLLGGALGMAMYGVSIAIGQFRGATPTALAISALGFGLVLEYFAGVFWEKRSFTVPPLWEGSTRVFDAVVTHQRVMTVVAAAVCFLLLLLLLEKTMAGWALEAVAHDRDLAATYGVRVSLSLIAVWALGGVLAALAGALVAPLSSVTRALALPLVVKGFAAAVVGGVNSIGGAVLGALVVAFAEALFIRYVSTSYASAFAFLLLFFVLAVRPQGILGDRRLVERA